MSTFVLVHGGWHGGWCWRKVTSLLRTAGHEMYTPTLTGLGERAHLANPAIDLAAHAKDVTALLEYEDLRDVVLVGHSLGGAVITSAADVAAHRLRRLVYLDAFVPEVGQSVFDLTSRAEFYEQQARDHGQGWLVPLDWDAALDGWGITDPADREWMRPRLSPQPLAVFKQARAGGADLSALPSSYLHCLRNPTVATFQPFADRAAANPATWSLHQLDAWHDPMITVPGQVAELLAKEG